MLKIKSITSLSSLEKIDIENDNIDLFVATDDGFTYNVNVGTPKNLQVLLEKNQVNYLEPDRVCIIVEKLTKEIIEEAIQAYAEMNDGYWLNLYHFSGRIDPTIFDQLKAETIKRQEELDQSWKFDELIAESKKFRKKLSELKNESLQNQLAEFDQECINLQKKLDAFYELI